MSAIHQTIARIEHGIRSLLTDTAVSMDERGRFRADRPLTGEEFFAIRCRVGRNRGPNLLMDMVLDRRIDVGEYPEVVAETWSAAEFPQQSVRAVDWVWLFRRAGYTVDGKPAALPTEHLTLYRGCGRGHQRRMSWTTDLEMAQWFSRRFTAGLVYTVTAPPTALLAAITDRDEAEIVVDTALLARTKVLTT